MSKSPKLGFLALSVAILATGGLFPLNASAQNFPSQSLNQLLNQVDDTSWNSVPVSNPRQVLPTPRTNQMAQMPMGQPSPYPMSPMQQFAPIGGMRQPLQSGPPPFSKQGLMRIFLEGGMGGGMGGGSGANPEDPSIRGNCEAQLQIARDQCAQAEGDAGRASSSSSKYERQNAASSAQYHANAARAAADNAYSSSYGKSQTAQNYAAQARNAANRAQEAADRARYNADSYQGSN